MKEARIPFEKGDFYRAGLALTRDLGARESVFAAVLLTNPPVALEESDLRQYVAELLLRPERWGEARPRFERLRREGHQGTPTLSHRLCEAALKLAHNLWAGFGSAQFDGDQAARMVMLIGTQAALDAASEPQSDVFDALVDAREQALAAHIPARGHPR